MVEYTFTSMEDLLDSRISSIGTAEATKLEDPIISLICESMDGDHIVKRILSNRGEASMNNEYNNFRAADILTNSNCLTYNKDSLEIDSNELCSFVQETIDSGQEDVMFDYDNLITFVATANPTTIVRFEAKIKEWLSECKKTVESYSNHEEDFPYDKKKNLAIKMANIEYLEENLDTLISFSHENASEFDPE